jgi:autotransporter-associated beta strand protein
LNGGGISNAGALRNISGTNTYPGLVTLGADSRINSDSGTLNLTNVGTITGSGFGLTIGGAGNTSISSIIGTGAGTLTKDGTGTVTLTAANTYTGSTTVSAGTLFVNGSLAAGSAVSVGASGTLGGIGTISGATTILGAHTPGTSPGIQTFASDLTYSGGSSSVEWELSGNTFTNAANPNAVYDQILVGGNLDFAAATSLSLLFNGAGSSVLWADAFWDAPQQWTLYDVTGSTTGFANLSLAPGSYLDSGSNSLASARSSASFSLVQSGNDVVVSYVAVPEPGGFALAGLGLAAAAFAYRRRRR